MFEVRQTKEIDEYGFKIPSAIQSRAISVIGDKRDLIAQSRSGTGKTGAFVIGMLTRIDVNKPVPQAIIIANTGALASQIHGVVCNISNPMGIKITLCIGGSDDRKNKSSIKAGINATANKVYKRSVKKFFYLEIASVLFCSDSSVHICFTLNRSSTSIVLLSVACWLYMVYRRCTVNAPASQKSRIQEFRHRRLFY